MELNEKVAYLKGLMEGMNYDVNTNEGKLFKLIADILEDVAVSTADLEDSTETLSEYVEEIDEDLGAVEEIIYDEDECDCEDDDDDFIEVECPNCGETVYFDEDIDPEHVVCPACGEEFSCICDCDDDDCDCGCCDHE